MLREEKTDIPGEQTIHRMVFGDRLLQARTNLKLSQEALAKAIGTTARSINRWEHNQTIPQHSYLVHLCQILQTTPEALFLSTFPRGRLLSSGNEPRRQVKWLRNERVFAAFFEYVSQKRDTQQW